MSAFVDAASIFEFYQGRRQGGGGGDGWGLHPSPDLKLMLLCVQVFTAKGRPKISKITREETNSFQIISSVTHTQIKA